MADPYTPKGPGPVSLKRQEHERVASTKWQTIQSQLIQQNATPRWQAAAASARINDKARLSQGKAPLTTKQTYAQMQAAHDMKPVTKPPEREIGGLHSLGNLVSDIKDIGIGLGHMIAAPFADISNISQTKILHDKLYKEIDRQSNPLTKMQHALGSGVQMIPVVRSLPFVKELGDTILHPFGAGIDSENNAERKAMVAEGLRNGVDRKTAIEAANEKYGTVQRGVSGVVDDVVNVLNSPGIRMIPGAMPLAALASTGDQRPGGGAAEILRHPGFNIASVLPLAHGLAKTTEAGALETTLARAEGRFPRPMSAAIKKTVEIGPDGEPMLALKPWAQDAANKFNDTKIGAGLHSGFGGREPVQFAYGLNQTLDNVMERNNKGVLHKYISSFNKNENIYKPLRRAEEFSQKLKNGDYEGLTLLDAGPLYHKSAEMTMDEILALPKPHQAAIAEAAGISADVTEAQIADGMLTRIMVNGRPEVFSNPEAKVILKAIERPHMYTELARKFVTKYVSPKLGDYRLDPRFNELSTAIADGDIAAARTLAHDIRNNGYGHGAVTPEGMVSPRFAHPLVADWKENITPVNFQLGKVNEVIDSTQAIIKSMGRSDTSAYRERLNGLYDQQAELQAKLSTGMGVIKERYGAELIRMAEGANVTDANFLKFAFGVDKGNAGIASEAAFRALENKGSKAPWGPAYMDARTKLVSSRQQAMLERILDKAYKAQKEAEGIWDVHHPSRFDPLLRVKLAEKLADEESTLAAKAKAIADGKPTDHIVNVVDPATRDRYIQMIQEGRAKDMVIVPSVNPETGLAFTKEEANAYTLSKIASDGAEIAATWQELADAGHNPVFYVNASAREIEQIGHSSMVRISKQATEKERGQFYNPAPHVQRIDVALTHPAWKMLENKNQRVFAQYVRDQFGVSYDDLVARYSAKARIMADRPGELRGYEELLDGLIGKGHTRYNPETYFQFQNTGPHQMFKNEDIYIPKWFAQTLEGMGRREVSWVEKAGSMPLTAFRIAVIGLSPRTQLNNITGNIINAAVELPSAVRNMRISRAMVSGDPERIAAMFNKLIAKGRIERGYVNNLVEDGGSWEQILSEMGSTHKDYAEQLLLASNTVGRMWDDFHASKNPLVRGMANVGTGLNKVTGKPAQAISNRMMVANSWVDDLTRGSVALSKVLKEFKRDSNPASAEAAAAFALNMARKTTMNWKALTPFERSTLRPIIPFYSWLRHITAFTFNYALDHPLRTALLGELMDLERSDEETGMPAIMRNMFYLGHDGTGAPELGAVGVNIGAMNPFAQMANSWGVLGFLSGDTQQAGAAAGGLSPLVKWGMQTLGMDPISGNAELYPELSYNAATGMIDSHSTEPLGNLAQSIIPQVGLIGPALKAVGAEQVGEMLSTNSDMERLRRTDPQGYRRKIYSTLNMPLLTRGFDPGSEVAKQETRLATSLEAVWKKALETGDMTEAKRWPDLVPRVRRFRKWAKDNPAEFKAMRMPQDSPEATAYQQQLDTLTQLPANGR